LGLGLAKGGVMDAQKRTEATKVQDRPVFESIRAYIEAEKNKTRLVGSDEFKSFVAAYSEMGNDDINVLWDLLELAEQELLGAQSRDRSSGLTDDDSKRFDAIFGKAVIYLEERVGKKIATDFPETGTMYESGE
jgi:hypothetical protein